MSYILENSARLELAKSYLLEDGLKTEFEKIYLLENGEKHLLWSGSLNMFVAVGGNKTLHSADGITWEEHSITLDGAACSDTVYSITYGNGLFVAAIGYIVAYSSDGINFFSNGTGTNTGNSSYFKVAYGNGTFVAIKQSGGNYPYYSADGINWTQGGNYIKNGCKFLRYLNEKFICVGNYNSTYQSSDGKSWGAVSGLTSGYTFQCAAYAFGKYYIFDQMGRRWSSSDGVTYTLVSSSTGIIDYTKSCAYNNDDIVAIVGYNSSIPDCAYMISDGTMKLGSGLDVSEATSSSAGIQSVIYHDKFVAVGSHSSGGYSLDGKTWTQTKLLSNTTTFYDVCYTNEE